MSDKKVLDVIEVNRESIAHLYEAIQARIKELRDDESYRMRVEGNSISLVDMKAFVKNASLELEQLEDISWRINKLAHLMVLYGSQSEIVSLAKDIDDFLSFNPTEKC